MEYFHRRAYELCPGGYDVMDRDASSRYVPYVIGESRGVTEKPEVSGVVECRFAPSVDLREVQFASQDIARWNCTIDPGYPATSTCFEQFNQCETFRKGMADRGYYGYSACIAQYEASCFEGISPAGSGKRCAGSEPACNAQRAVFLDEKASQAGPCARTR